MWKLVMSSRTVASCAADLMSALLAELLSVRGAPLQRDRVQPTSGGVDFIVFDNRPTGSRGRLPGLFHHSCARGRQPRPDPRSPLPGSPAG